MTKSYRSSKTFHGLFLGSLFSFTALTFAVLNPVRAEVVQFVDGAGKSHFVDSPEKVPDAYRDQLKNQRALPAISRAAPGREKLFEREHYANSAAGKKVEVFVTSWCPYCKKLEEYLQAQHVQYTKYDIERDAKGKLIHDQLGGGGVPVVRIGEKQVVHGFDQQALGKALGTIQ